MATKKLRLSKSTLQRGILSVYVKEEDFPLLEQVLLRYPDAGSVSEAVLAALRESSELHVGVNENPELQSRLREFFPDASTFSAAVFSALETWSGLAHSTLLVVPVGPIRQAIEATELLVRELEDREARIVTYMVLFHNLYVAGALGVMKQHSKQMFRIEFDDEMTEAVARLAQRSGECQLSDDTLKTVESIVQHGISVALEAILTARVQRDGGEDVHSEDETPSG